MKTFPLLLLICLINVSHAAQPAYPSFDNTHIGTALDLSGFTIEWRDDFNTLQATRVGRGTGPWFPGIHSVLAPGEKMASLPDPAFRVASGVLTMSTRLDPVDSLRVEAHLQTDDGRGNSVMFQNGYIEARLALPAALGSHAGIWLLSKEEGQGHVEIDIVETYGAGDRGIHSSTHIWPKAPLTNQYDSNYHGMTDIYGVYHLYGLLATEQSFTFFVDRKEVARIFRLPEQRVPMYVLLSVFGNPSQPVIEPATMLVDYVHIYTQKVPQAPTLRSVE